MGFPSDFELRISRFKACAAKLRHPTRGQLLTQLAKMTKTTPKFAAEDPKTTRESPKCMTGTSLPRKAFCTFPYVLVRTRTISYDVVRCRTFSYDPVRFRTISYAFGTRVRLWPTGPVRTYLGPLSSSAVARPRDDVRRRQRGGRVRGVRAHDAPPPLSLWAFGSWSDLRTFRRLFAPLVVESLRSISCLAATLLETYCSAAPSRLIIASAIPACLCFSFTRPRIPAREKQIKTGSKTGSIPHKNHVICLGKRSL